MTTAPTQSRPSLATTDARSDRVRAALAAVLPEGALVGTPESVERYSHDEAEWAPYVPALAVVRPRTAEQVQAVVRVCLEHGVPVVPRGAGTGLSGGANATAGSVVVSLEAMDAVLEVNPLERYAVVQPGRGQRPPPRRGRRAGPLVPAGPGQLALVDHRRQRRHERRRRLLREVRRDRRLRPRAPGGHRARASWSGSDAGPPRASPATTSPRCSSARRARSASSPRSPSGCGRRGRRSTPSSATSTRS